MKKIIIFICTFLFLFCTDVKGTIYTVTNSNDSGTGSLRQALSDANGAGAQDTIVFDASTDGNPIVLLSPLIVNDDVVIVGNGAIGVTIIEGNHIYVDPYNLLLFDIQFSNSTNRNVLADTNSFVLINRCLFEANSGTQDGGCVFNAGVMRIFNSTATNNTSTNVGGFLYNAGNLRVINSTLYLNNSDFLGGAIVNEHLSGGPTTMTLMSCTFSQNSSAGGVQDIVMSGTNNTADTISNCIFDVDNVANTNILVQGAVLFNEHNIVETCLGSDPPFCPTWHSSAEPDLDLSSGLQDLGGGILVLVPNGTSPAVNDGGLLATTEDQSGIPRDGSPDIGATEYVSSGPLSLIVTNSNDAGTGSLRQAILDANLNPGEDFINFDGSTDGNPIQLNTSITITDSVQIYGNGAQTTTIDFQNNLDQKFQIDAGVRANFESLTVVNATSNGNGGAFCVSGVLNMLRATIENCTAGNFGGAIFTAPGGDVFIGKSSFINNSADIGGGAVFMDTASTGLIHNSTFYGNSLAIGGQGGAIGMILSTFSIYNNTIVNNNVAGSGGTDAGGVYMDAGSTFDISNCIIASNINGSGLMDYYGGASLSGNTANLVEVKNAPDVFSFGSPAETWSPLSDCGGLSYVPLVGGSAAIDNGAAGSADDICDAIRDGSPDIGASEYVVVPCTISDQTVTAGVTSITCGQFATVDLASSEIGITYNLMSTVDSIPIAAAQTGTGGSLSFATGLMNETTSFYVVAVDSLVSTCELILSNKPIVSVTPPADLNVVSDSVVCWGDSVLITVQNTENNLMYYLRDDANDTIVAGPFPGDGTDLDMSTGPVSGPMTYNVLAVAGGMALDFDGLDDIVNLTSTGVEPAGGAARTIEAWIKTSTISTNVNGISVFSYGTNNLNQRMDLRLKNTNQSIYIGLSGASSSLVRKKTGKNISDGIWHHLAMSYPGGNAPLNNASLYLDGELLTVTGVNSAEVPATLTGLMTLGGRILGARFFEGTIDEVRLWDYARSKEEILNNMRWNLTGSESGLVAYFNLDEGPGHDFVSDNAGNGHGGNMVNMDNIQDWVPGFDGCQIELTKKAIVDLQVQGFYTLQPISQVSCDGDTVIFSVDGGGGADAIVWQESIDNGATWNDITLGAGIYQGDFLDMSLTGITSNMSGNMYRSRLFACGVAIDSTASASLTISFETRNQNVSVCDSFFVGGAWQTTGGVYQDTLFLPGCDSLITTTLTIASSLVNQTVTPQISAYCNPGISANLDVITTQAGVDYYLYVSSNDSLITGPITGAGGTLSIPTHILNTTTDFYVYASQSGCGLRLTPDVTIEVGDTTKPNMVCDSNFVFDVGQDPFGIITVLSIASASSDNCILDTMFLDKDTITCSDIGFLDIKVTGIDLTGNVGECVASLEVIGGYFLDAGPDLSITVGDSIWLQGDGSMTDGSYFWSPDSLISQNGLLEVIVKPLDSTVFTLEWTSPDSSCIITDSMQLNVMPIGPADLVVYELVTPNGDGQNDYFAVNNPALMVNYELALYDRYGTQIYFTLNYNNTWAAQDPNTGSFYPDGVYYYEILDITSNSNVPVMKGAFTILGGK